jgi:glucan 1,3-beta-glucosidase
MFPNADRLALDTHPYLAFGTQSDSPMSTFVNTPCSRGGGVNTSMGAFGLTTAGEFSNAVNDCALYLNNVGAGSRYEGTYDGGGTRVGSCTPWNDYQNYDATMKSSIRQFALSSMDALQVCSGFFFEAPLVVNLCPHRIISSGHGRSAIPHVWQSRSSCVVVSTRFTTWMDAHGPSRCRWCVCGNSNPWTPPLRSWQTGGAGIGIPPSVSSSYAWPPTTISQAGSVSTLPFYTPTGTIPTLPVPTFTGKSINAGNGWANPSDTTRMHVPIPTCTYLDPWVDPGTAPPASCGAALLLEEQTLL